MTELSTHLPQKVVQSNKKLQEIDVTLYKSEFGDIITSEQYFDFEDEANSVGLPAGSSIEKHTKIITIADIIDNAEMLLSDNLWTGKDRAVAILRMCQQDKPIEEISEYIVKNIKGED